ncbi:hypothetical protein A2803_02725 [Candidatus Woesebacteria bacterium RIFCSPHIGHO2_01_FULL_44_21]|uniref:Yip1 domain-containing protein n=1 Tax=Candidatus Woesebacteria bacterium RIFCSPHIGHO2_01_FULL_44_21 TaxID=1802503 RepID=A0A1F7YYK9_9BACT|nr:MAG: hypothetical protein A2803_02725 [Candidatus Woesebacteria bacterium RIFCSPHIGHO2_01_FULL_44_21]OGM69813.1 MAG: hypothetical protein A2897_00520 [Candidatus Woesebacteria bacterium RIFCSPLOWO2_01_FULL_44_24b]
MELTIDVKEIMARVREVLTAPKKFFGKAKKEHGWKKAFSFVLVVAGAGHILTALYNILIYPLVSPTFAELFGIPAVQLNAGQVAGATLVSFIVTLGMSFIWGAALKVWLAIFKVKSNFDSSYRVMAYSRTPNYLFSWLPLVNILIAIYSFYLLVLGLENEYGIPRGKAILIIVTSVVVIFVVSILAVSLIPTI